MSNDIPDPFLTSLFPQSSSWEPITLCAGYDGGEWRCDQLAKHLTEWVLEFSLRHSERTLIPQGKIVSAVRDAATRVFKHDSPTRGEAGELLLHVACRQEFQTSQLIARLYYKSSLDEQIHGFDCVHFRQLVDSTIELWLGESKLYTTANSAIAEARKSILQHIDRGFISAQKTLIAPKLADEAPEVAERVRYLFHKNTPIDEFVSAMVIPVMIACDSEAVFSHSARDESYLTAAHTEMADISDRLRKGTQLQSLTIQPIYVPLLSKETFRKAFSGALKGLQ